MCYFRAFNSRDMSDFLDTIKALINARAFIQNRYFSQRGGGRLLKARVLTKYI